MAKRSILIGAVVLLMVLVAGCGESESRFGDTIAFEDDLRGITGEITVQAPILQEPTLLQTEDTDLYVLSATIVNTSDEVTDYNLIYWECQDNEGLVYPPSLFVQEQAMSSGQLHPGDRVEGYVGFELPKGNTVASVTYQPMFVDVTCTWEQ